MAVTEEKRVNTKTTALATRRDEHRVAAVACGAHALHDGFTDLIYVLLPLWQKEFGLGYGEPSEGLMERKPRKPDDPILTTLLNARTLPAAVEMEIEYGPDVGNIDNVESTKIVFPIYKGL